MPSSKPRRSGGGRPGPGGPPASVDRAPTVGGHSGLDRDADEQDGGGVHCSAGLREVGQGAGGQAGLERQALDVVGPERPVRPGSSFDAPGRCGQATGSDVGRAAGDGVGRAAGGRVVAPPDGIDHVVELAGQVLDEQLDQLDQDLPVPPVELRSWPMISGSRTGTCESFVAGAAGRGSGGQCAVTPERSAQFAQLLSSIRDDRPGPTGSGRPGRCGVGGEEAVLSRAAGRAGRTR